MSLTKGYLCPKGAFNGRVHSVFRRSLNITINSIDAPWVSLLDSTLPATPTAYQCGFELLEDLRVRVKVGDQVFMRGGIIRIKSSTMLSINTLSALPWQPAPSVLMIDRSRVKDNFTTTEKILSEHLLKKDKLKISSVNEYLAYLDLKLPNNIDFFSEVLINNIGFGKGLTPSGDDFLIGVMAVLSNLIDLDPKAKTLYQNMQATIGLNIHKTTDISAHYLSLALSHHFSHPVHWLVYHLLTQTEVAIMQSAVTTNLNIGASSGADTIAGMLFCLNELYGLNEPYDLDAKSSN